MVMKFFNLRLTIALLGLALAVGCQSSNDGKPSGAATTPTEPTHVKVLYIRPHEPYVEVGPVSVPRMQSDRSETWQAAFQRQAAAEGADAVIVDTTTINNLNAPLINGTAIRFKPKPE